MKKIWIQQSNRTHTRMTTLPLLDRSFSSQNCCMSGTIRPQSCTYSKQEDDEVLVLQGRHRLDDGTTEFSVVEGGRVIET